LIGNFFRHLHTVNSHRRLVRKGCFKIGLYRQGITHDLSKYSPTEFLAGIRYWQGYRSPNNAEREDKGISYSWLHHKGRNKHHYEYWTDYNPEQDGGPAIIPVRMPNRYIAEMLMDRIAASKIYLGDDYTDRGPLEYYERIPHGLIMEKNTQQTLEYLLHLLADEGEDAVCIYIKNHLLKEESSKT